MCGSNFYESEVTLKIQYYYPALIELQNAPLTYALLQ